MNIYTDLFSSTVYRYVYVKQNDQVEKPGAVRRACEGFQ